MELLQEGLLNIIRGKCSSFWQLSVFMNHIIINIPDKEDDFRFAFNKAKHEITECVKQHFPERNSDVLFEVRSASWNCSFKLRKTEA